MRDYLTSEIAKRVSELEAMDRRRVIVDVELRLLEEMMRHLGESAARRHQVSIATPIPLGGAGAARAEAAVVKAAQLHPRWGCVMAAAVKRYPASVTNEEVPEIQRAAGEEPSHGEGIRTHVSTQAKVGRYEKIGRGTLRATQAGADALGDSAGIV